MNYILSFFVTKPINKCQECNKIINNSKPLCRQCHKLYSKNGTVRCHCDKGGRVLKCGRCHMYAISCAYCYDEIIHNIYYCNECI